MVPEHSAVAMEMHTIGIPMVMDSHGNGSMFLGHLTAVHIPPHTCTHTYAHIPTHMHTYLHICTHTYT